MDVLTSEQRSEQMRKVRSENTKPELAVRTMLSHLGYRYRLHAKDITGTPDIVFRARRKIIFIHGCFWHRHSDKECRLARLPKSNVDFWMSKLEGNRRRDEITQTKLLASGWTMLVIWECQTKNLSALKMVLVKFLAE